MERKKKICAGWDGNSHEDYIFKNINGKKYCKSCTYKLQPQKPIKKISDKQVFKIKLKQTQLQKDKLFYLNVWKERFYVTLSFGEEIMIQSPRCQVCKKRLGEEPNLTFFHHILEKRNYPELRHVIGNIAILCTDCHSSYESNPLNVPYLVDLREKLKTIFNK